MNLLIKATSTECRGPQTRLGVQDSCGCEMDPSITGMTYGMGKNAIQVKEVQKPRPKEKKYLDDKARFQTQGELIPIVTEQLINNLGKWSDSTIKKGSSRRVRKQVDNWLTAVKGSELPGKFKTWCYQFRLLPRLQWPLLIYEVPTSAAEAMERRVSHYLLQWLGAPPGLSRAALYSASAKLTLPFSSVLEE